MPKPPPTPPLLLQQFAANADMNAKGQIQILHTLLTVLRLWFVIPLSIYIPILDRIHHLSNGRIGQARLIGLCSGISFGTARWPGSGKGAGWVGGDGECLGRGLRFIVRLGGGGCGAGGRV